MDDLLKKPAIITLSFEAQTNKQQLTMHFPDEVNVIRRIKSLAFYALEARPVTGFRRCSVWVREHLALRAVRTPTTARSLQLSELPYRLRATRANAQGMARSCLR